MLPMERFPQETHAQRMETVRRRVPLLTEDWNDFQPGDPGVTLAELLSWRVGLQRQAMEKVAPASEARLMTLLGVPPRHARGSRALLEPAAPPRPLGLPAGVKWRAGDVVFENPAPLLLPAARLTELRFPSAPAEEPGSLGPDRSAALFGETPRPGDWFELVFDAPLPAGAALCLALELAPPDGRIRPPVPAGERLVPLADIRWQAGGDGWQDVAVERDDTHGLLFSGLLRLRVPGGAATRLRATLTEGEFDLPPRLTGVLFPALEVVQRDTLCRTETVSAGALRAGRGVLRGALALEGDAAFYRRRGEDWVPCEAALAPDETAGLARVTVAWTPEGADGAAELLAVTAARDRCPPPADGQGCSGQVWDWETPGLCRENLALLVGRAGRFSLWTPEEDLYGCGPTDRRFTVDPDGGAVGFGDGRMGAIPPKGGQNLRFAALALTAGAAANLRPDQIGGPAGGLYAGLTVRRSTAAQGGRDEESHAARKARCARPPDEPRRAVTAGDFETLARRAPGLLLDGVEVLPGRVLRDGRLRDEPGTVTVLIRGAGGGRPAGYLENLRRWLEPRRLAGTRVEVNWLEP